MVQHPIDMHRDELAHDDIRDVVEDCYMSQSPLESVRFALKSALPTTAIYKSTLLLT